MVEEKNIVTITTRLLQFLSRINRTAPDYNMIETALAFTFLRRIDCMIGQYALESASFYSKHSDSLSEERLAEKLSEKSGGYSFYNYSGYTLNAILLTTGNIEVVLNSYVQGFSKNVLEILDGMNFHHNLAILQRKSYYLIDIIRYFAKLDLSCSSIDNEEFIELVSSLLDVGTREIHYNYTDFNLSNFICECLMSDDVRDSKEDIITVYDPVCGTGSMLAIAGEKAKKLAIHQANISLCGQEISILPSAVAKALILLSGNDDSKVIYGNTLTEDFFADYRFQYILADMPFGLQWSQFKDRIEKESLEDGGRFHMGLPSTGDSQFLFIEHILSKMDPKGCRAAFITTGSVLWGGSASSGESRIRRWLFENDIVETIIALPSGMLKYTGIPVFLWILSNKKKDSQKGTVRLIDLSVQEEKNVRFSLGKGFLKSSADIYKALGDSSFSKTIKNEQFGFYEVGLLLDGKKSETIKISLDADIHNYIAKELQPFAKGEITVDYSTVEKGYSIQFEKYFAQEEDNIMSLKDESHDIMSILDILSSFKKEIDIINNMKEDDSFSKSWSELPLRAVIDVILGINKAPLPDDNGLPILSVSFLRQPSENSVLYAVTPKTRCSSVDDVIVIVRGANSGEVFKGVDGILSPSLAVIKCSNQNILAPQYLYYLIKGYEKSLMAISKGAAIKSLDSKSINDIKCLIPSIEEQLRITKYLDSVVGKIDKVISFLKSNDNVFVSYRQTLIENIVRGKMKICLSNEENLHT